MLKNTLLYVNVVLSAVMSVFCNTYTFVSNSLAYLCFSYTQYLLFRVKLCIFRENYLL